MSFTILKKNPTQGEITSNLTGSTGDGAGLHFNGSGYVSAGDTTVIDGATKLSVEVVVATTAADDGEMIAKAHAATALRFFVNSSGQVVFRVNNGSGNGTATSSGTVIDGNPTHIVGVWDGSTVKIYINGNEDGSAALSGGAVPNIADKLALGTQLSSSDSTANSFTGTLYRARIWNKAVDAKALFERADVDFADQYGSQTELVTNGDFASATGWSQNNVTISGDGNAVWAVSGGDQWVRRGDWNITAGKKYRITVVSSAHTTNGSFQVFTYGATSTIATTDLNGDAFTISGTGTHIFEFEALADSSSGVLFGRYPTGAAYVGTMTDLSCVQIGAVSDYQTQWANPSQSLTVQDASGNADGTCSASGVTQVQPVVQLNATAARIGTSAGTPADRELLLDKYLKFSDIYPQVVTSSTASEMTISGGNATSNGANIGLRGSTHGTPSSVRFRSGTTTTLTIDASGQITQAGEGVSYTIKNSDTSLAADQLIGGVAFEKTDGSGAGAGVVGGMRMHSEGSVGESSYLAFSTADSSTNDVERVRITSDGSVGIGTPTPTVGNLQIRDASVSTFALTRTTGNTGASLGIIRFGNTDVDSNLANIVGYQDGATDSAAIAFQTQPTGGTTTTRLTIASDGLATFAQRIHGVGGISFGQTNSSATGAAAVSTILDHYEEGTFTASLTFGGGDTGITYALNSNKGIYTRIGNMVYIALVVELTNKGTSTGTALITGLPFIVSDELAATSLENALTSAFNNVGLAHAYATGTTPVINLKNSSNNSLTSSDFSNSSSIRLAGWYTTP